MHPSDPKSSAFQIIMSYLKSLCPLVSKGLLWPWINSGILLMTELSSKPVVTSSKHSINVNKGCLLRKEVLVGSNLSSNLKQKIKYDPYI